MSTIIEDDQPLRAFLSSSMVELELEREAIETALHEIGVKAFRWEAPEAASASPIPIREQYVLHLAESDIYVGVFGCKYGQWTIDEFVNASARKKPRFVYASEPRKNNKGRDEALTSFLSDLGKVSDGLTIGWFTSTADLTMRIKRDVVAWKARTNRGQRAIPQDAFDWTRLRNVLAARSRDTLSADAYKKKFDPQLYVPRKETEQKILAFLDDSGGPLKFMVAESGLGKTCFIRHLCLQIEAQPIDSGWATLILRGISAGIDKENGLQSYLCGILSQEFRIPSESRLDALEMLDRWLDAIRRKVLIIVDGVNEANNTRAVFGSIVDVVQRLTVRASGEGRKTCVKLLVTSRPLAFDDFIFQDQASEQLQGVLRMAGEPKIDEPIVLERLDATELDAGLRNAKLEPKTVKGHLREVLSDPLMLGYFCEVAARGEAAEDVRTPLDLIKRVWALQAKALQAEVKGKPLDPRARVVDICREMLARVSDTAAPEWTSDDRQIMVSNVLVFEEIRDAEGRVKGVRFRYDRVAHFLIARHAILRGPDAQLRDSKAVVACAVRTVIVGKGRSVLILPDVIRSAVVTAVVSLFEREFKDPAPAEATVLGLLDPPESLFDKVPPTVRGAVLLELGEMVYDALVEAARWDATAVVSFLLRWFSEHPLERESPTAAVLRRVAFNLLLSSATFSGTGSALDPDSKARLCTLGAEALLTDSTGDACVLLHALYTGGAEQTALEVIRIAIFRFRQGDRKWHPVRRLPCLVRVATAMILIFPLADPMPPEFVERIRELFREIPTWLVGVSLAAIAEAALKENSMPVRADEWLTLVKTHESRRRFRRTTLLLQVRGWSGPLRSRWSSIGHAVAMIDESRNAFIAQLLTHAVSGRISCETGDKRRMLLDDLRAEVQKLRQDVAAALDRDGLRDDANYGLVGYALSLVCYHLLVFDLEALEPDEAIQVFDLMEVLATEVLLISPLTGRFRLRSGGPRETSNIIGTFGRAAIAVVQPDRFKDLISRLCDQKTSRGLQSDGDFTSFLFESFGTLGTLSADPKLALDGLHRLGKTLGYFEEEDDDEIRPSGSASSSRDAMLKSLLQIRDLHPFEVEQHLKSHLGSHAYFLIEKIRAARITANRESSESKGGILSRHLSWVFEHGTEKIVLKHPVICRIIASDIVHRLTPDGLKSISIVEAIRLDRFSRGLDPRVISGAGRVMIVLLSGVASVGSLGARLYFSATSKTTR